MIRNSSILDVTLLGNIAIDGDATLRVIDPILDTVVVILERRFVVKNIAFEGLEVIALKVVYSADGPGAVRL